MDWISDGLGNEMKELWQCWWLRWQHDDKYVDVVCQLKLFNCQY